MNVVHRSRTIRDNSTIRVSGDDSDVKFEIGRRLRLNRQGCIGLQVVTVDLSDLDWDGQWHREPVPIYPYGRGRTEVQAQASTAQLIGQTATIEVEDA